FCQPKNQGARIRWAELLMGRNSVNPCKMPKKRAWTEVEDASIPYRFSLRGSLRIRSPCPWWPGSEWRLGILPVFPSEFLNSIIDGEEGKVKKYLEFIFLSLSST
ncbi:MAG: hypothetical protein Q7T83_11830, partial [Thermodesulfovibrionales bacterium]|nr:hypothetical protein [Thermodesulfovibrionales bacterium]